MSPSSALLLHCNKLPPNHLILAVNGKTSGSSTLTGPIGKQLPVEEIDNDDACLSKDHKYLLRMYLAVSFGDSNDQLASNNTGKMHHARW